MGKFRLEAFSDDVLAIIITIMELERWSGWCQIDASRTRLPTMRYESRLQGIDNQQGFGRAAACQAVWYRVGSDSPAAAKPSRRKRQESHLPQAWPRLSAW